MQHMAKFEDVVPGLKRGSLHYISHKILSIHNLVVPLLNSAARMAMKTGFHEKLSLISRRSLPLWCIEKTQSLSPDRTGFIRYHENCVQLESGVNCEGTNAGGAGTGDADK